ncbi:hypothetical protein L1O03_11210 [Corynebacterium uropygiale]|uniref:Uncharacterized protein n=1 Tax=Corynebacterium uropygiale TaxID=1775911 RepID=A0A9X1U8D8_9CORY|nr:hypothetical protein [Corynebacterium uropygiale]MCF4007732.1 hypothetical protein [Corynebacterium uropygiale]
MRKLSLFHIGTAAFIILWTLQIVALSTSVKEWLDQQTGVPGGGLAYAVCFLVAGLSLSGVAAYSGYLYHQGWETARFCRALKIGVMIAALAAIVCTIWFMISPGYMNPVGLLGLAVSLATWAWVSAIANQGIREHHHPQKNPTPSPH